MIVVVVIIISIVVIIVINIVISIAIIISIVVLASSQFCLQHFSAQIDMHHNYRHGG